MYFCADTNIFYQRHTLHLLKKNPSTYEKKTTFNRVCIGLYKRRFCTKGR